MTVDSIIRDLKKNPYFEENMKAFEDWEEKIREEYVRICDSSCSHFDTINMCCWQATMEYGLCFDIEEGDYCHLGYKERV